MFRAFNAIQVTNENSVGIHEIGEIRLNKACLSLKGAVNECLSEPPFKKRHYV